MAKKNKNLLIAQGEESNCSRPPRSLVITVKALLQLLLYSTKFAVTKVSYS